MKIDLQQFSSTECADMISACVCFDTPLGLFNSVPSNLAVSQLIDIVECDLRNILHPAIEP